jgi:FAD/FMN-containing dehydrogenase
MRRLKATGIEVLRENFKGKVLFPGDGVYEDARKIWNAMIDKHPALIARCISTSDVVAAVNFAREEGLPLAVRGGGHNIAGSALCDDGLVIDLSGMKAAIVDPGAGRVTIEGGATLADLDAATQAHGPATPVGINSTTGIAGLTLGGGFGLAQPRKVRVDHRQPRVLQGGDRVRQGGARERQRTPGSVLGSSRRRRQLRRRHPLQFRLTVGPNVLSGLIVYPLSEAKSVLQQYREFAAKAPDDLSVWTVLRQAPPLPFLPKEVHGKGVVVLALLYAGDPKQGEPLTEHLRRFGTPVGEHVGVQPYTAWQQAFDPLLTAGARNYWKSHNLARLDDALLDAVIACVEGLPSPQCELFFAALGGATTRTAPDSTAYAHRDAQFVMNVHGRWEDQADDERCIRWARECFNATAPFAAGGVYVNFLTADEGDRVRSAYGPNYERLSLVKRAYDPSNLFRMNQNIAPARSRGAALSSYPWPVKPWDAPRNTSRPGVASYRLLKPRLTRECSDRGY